MTQFLIEGPTKLAGKFVVGGSKNAVLPIMAATLLSDQSITLRNVPDIGDVATMVEILQHLGVSIERHDHTLVIDASRAQSRPIPASFSGRMRASILLLGPLLGRFGEAILSYPGGDIIGSRPINSHVDTLRGLGYTVELSDEQIIARGKSQGGDITIEALSVTGTENALMAAVLGAAPVKLRLAAAEPHVSALCTFLAQMGAQIQGAGGHTLEVQPVAHLHGTEYTIIPDYLEAGTLAITAAASRSSLQIEGFWRLHNEALLWALGKIGVPYTMENNDTTLSLHPGTQLAPISLRTDIFPGFPSDLQAPLAVLLTQASGTSELFETVFEGRLHYLKDLARLGANVFAKDTHTGVIIGPTPLFGREVVSIDIRAGATMVMAALLAEGQTTVDHIEHIDRGYERLDERLNAVGARIRRIENGGPNQLPLEPHDSTPHD